jgi:hypothetical protein
MMHGRRITTIALFATVVQTSSGAAQQWRTLDASRQLRDTGAHQVRVQYGAGRLEVRPSADPVLYSMSLRYDEENGRPVHEYDPNRRRLTVGLTDQSFRFARHSRESMKSDLRLALSPQVPVDLDLNVGAAKADMDLGGLSVRDARIRIGASSSVLDFSAPNKTELRSLDVDVGAASFTAHNLGNANTTEMQVRSGVGSVTLDFGGEWRNDMSLDADVALGKLEIRVPSDVGVRVDVHRVLASFDRHGLVKRGNAYYSENWETARHKLRVRAATTFGAIEVRQR